MVLDPVCAVSSPVVTPFSHVFTGNLADFKAWQLLRIPSAPGWDATAAWPGHVSTRAGQRVALTAKRGRQGFSGADAGPKGQEHNEGSLEAAGSRSNINQT